ncbi:hypothetical protein IG631_24301 [Alternaria alternata]|nr:hypothetical protein IG631_24301 [Alternaria alternata]
MSNMESFPYAYFVPSSQGAVHCTTSPRVFGTTTESTIFFVLQLYFHADHGVNTCYHAPSGISGCSGFVSRSHLRGGRSEHSRITSVGPYIRELTSGNA